MQRVLKAVRRREPSAESAFMSHCRAYGKCDAAEMEQGANTFVTFLHTTFGGEFANALVPELVKLLPDADKRAALVSASGVTIDQEGGVVAPAAASGGEEAGAAGAIDASLLPPVPIDSDSSASASASTSASASASAGADSGSRSQERRRTKDGKAGKDGRTRHSSRRLRGQYRLWISHSCSKWYQS